MTPLHLMTIRRNPAGNHSALCRHPVLRPVFPANPGAHRQNWDYTLHGIFFRTWACGHRTGSSMWPAPTWGRPWGTSSPSPTSFFRKLRPDAVLLLGDTNSCLSAISAKRLQIPIFHMEAGNRCFDSRVPEEINRRIVDVPPTITCVTPSMPAGISWPWVYRRTGFL